MRTILCRLCFLAFAVPAMSQQPLAGSTTALPDAPGWSRAEALRPNAKLHIAARTGSASCRFKSADDGSLTCVGEGTKLLAFQRAEVRKVTSPRRGWSAIIGLGIGIGVGAILGAAAGDSCTPSSFICFSRGSLAALFAVPLGAVGAGVGALTDFDRKTIYSAH